MSDKEYLKKYHEQHKEESKQYREQHKEEIRQYKEQHKEERKEYEASDHASIYIIENKINGKVYVGSTCRKLRFRWIDHKSHMKKSPHLPLYSDMIKYGVDNFKFIILFTADKQYAKAAEQHVIDGFCNIELYNQIKAKRRAE